MTKIITRTQAAALVGVCGDTLARWHTRTGMDFPRPIEWANGRRYYSEDDVLAWLRARTGSSGGP